MVRKHSAYNAELARILGDDRAAPAPAASATSAEIEAEISSITKALSGRLSNLDRLDAIAARATLRKQLSALERAPR